MKNQAEHEAAARTALGDWACPDDEGCPCDARMLERRIAADRAEAVRVAVEKERERWREIIADTFRRYAVPACSYCGRPTTGQGVCDTCSSRARAEGDATPGLEPALPVGGVMTDNPSSGPSKGPTRGEEIAETWRAESVREWRHRPIEAAPPSGSLQFPRMVNLVRLIDSALASQEARHQQEMEPLLHASDKQAVAWKARALKAEQELAEAKRERDEARETAAARLRHIEMHMKAQGARSLIQQRNALMTKLREAEAREKVLREGLTDVAIPTLRYCERKFGIDDQARLNCEAALRSSPAPQEQTDAEPAEGWPCKCGHGRYSCVPECPCQSYEPKGEPG